MFDWCWMGVVEEGCATFGVRRVWCGSGGGERTAVVVVNGQQRIGKRGEREKGQNRGGGGVVWWWNLVRQEDVDAIEAQRPKLLLLVHQKSLKHYRFKASQSTISWLMEWLTR
ncbi:hypothetical protein RHGRI_029341 [Rhododendron griersonianum]|uniref:Uncharacterized protein n=1 Tax=Rhododendron griersonianum TaxID=479676 RepID=A0AAV6IJ68_9ERIC|nr:hypothetical protein RHGRI_029341 [Rhododendron griersonianum]